MKKFFTLFMFVAALTVTVSCKSAFTPRNTGAMTGVAVYTGYSECVKGELIGNDLETRINKLWDEVNTLEKIDDVKATADKLATAFDEVIASEKLSESQKANLLALKNMITDKVNTIITDDLTPNSEAIEFLQGLREGVNACIEAGKDVEGKKVTAKDAAKAIGEKIAAGAATALVTKAVNTATEKKEEVKAEEAKADTTSAETATSNTTEVSK